MGVTQGKRMPTAAGVRMGNTKYMFVRHDPEDNVCYLSKVGGGGCVVRTRNAIVIGIWDKHTIMSNTNSLLYNISPFTKSNATVATTMIKNSLSRISMNTLTRLNDNKQTNEEARRHPCVTPVHSDDEESNNNDQSSECVTIFQDYHSFFPVPEQIMIKYDTYHPLSPKEAINEDQLADFFTGFGEASFLIKKEEENERKIESRIMEVHNSDATKRRRWSESSSPIDEYDTDVFLFMEQCAKRRRFEVE